MDKRVVFAVAGAGKTTSIVNELEETSRALIITYTNNNLYNLRKKIIDKFGYVPEGLYIETYFTFVYGFCFRPFLLRNMDSAGILFQKNTNRFIRKTDDRYFLSSSRRLYSDRIALLIKEKGMLDAVRQRIEKYFDIFIVDEVQDFSAHDFNLLREIIKANVKVLLVGDYFQHTFDTGRDGNIRKNLHDNFIKYKKEFSDSGIGVDEQSLVKSWRCSITVCEFVKSNLGINIESRTDNRTEIRELTDKELADVMEDDAIIKLFYDRSSIYNLNARNWGESKGEDRYEDVCVILNQGTYRLFKNNQLSTMNKQTRNKLYVAITRARGNVYFVDRQKLDSYKFN